jgi:hypothetical protein
MYIVTLVMTVAAEETPERGGEKKPNAYIAGRT